MSGYTIKWVGWNQEGGSDKIWGWLQMDDGRYFAFWGRRQKTLRFKAHSSYMDVDRLQYQKETKGYRRVSPERHPEVLGDEFQTDLEISCMTAILSESVM